MAVLSPSLGKEEELEGMASFKRVVDPARQKLSALGDHLEPLNRMFQILKQEALTGLIFHIRSRFGARARLLIIVSLIILPAALALFFTKAYAVNVSAYDDLAAMPPLYDKVYSGHLSFADLFAQWNEHRIFFPRLVMLSLGLITHHNTVVECYFSWFLVCLTGGVLFLAHRRIFGTRETALVAFVPISWLIFDPVQAQNFVQGFQMQVFMVALFFLLAMYLLATSMGLWWRFALSVASGVVSTFSMSNGVLVWPIGLILILWLRQSQPKEVRRLYLKKGAIWCLVGIAVLVSYFIGYSNAGGHEKMQYLIQHPLSSVAFFLAAIGSLAQYLPMATAMGLLLLLLYAYAAGTVVCQGKARLSGVLSLSLILFALLSLAAWTVNRSLLGLGQALAERGTTISILGIVGLYLATTSLQTKYVKVKGFLVGFLVSLILLSGALSYYYGIKQAGSFWKSLGEWQAYYLSTYTVQSDENLRGVYPWGAQIAREGAEILEKYKLNVFSRPSLDVDQLTPVEGSTQFAVNSVQNVEPQMNQQGQWIVSISLDQETLAIWGWAVDEQAKAMAGGVFVTIDGQKEIPTLYGLDRPDVAAGLGDSRYRASGFVASFSTSVVGEGQHVLSLKIVTADKKGYYEPDQKIILEVA